MGCTPHTPPCCVVPTEHVPKVSNTPALEQEDFDFDCLARLFSEDGPEAAGPTLNNSKTPYLNSGWLESFSTSMADFIASTDINGRL